MTSSPKASLMEGRGGKTLTDDAVPAVFREPYIRSGYRVPYRPWRYYLLSLFSMHNETVNAWSHLGAACLFVARVFHLSYTVDYMADPRGWGLLAFALGAISYATLSGLAHLLQSRSELAHHTCFQLDYMGIGLNAQGSGILFFHLSHTPRLHGLVSAPVFLAINALLACTITVCCIIAKLRYDRPYPPIRKIWQLTSCACAVAWGALPFFVRFLPCLLPFTLSNGVTNYSCDDNAETLGVHARYVLAFFAAACFFSSSMPERLLPVGVADIVGQGHQIFHLLSAYMTLRQFDAAEYDYVHRPVDLAHFNDDSLSLVFGWQLFVILFSVAFIWYERDVTHRKCSDLSSTNTPSKKAANHCSEQNIDFNANIAKCE